MRQTGLRPLSVGEILDVSIKVYRQLFATLARVVAVVTVPIVVIELVVQLSVLPTESFSFSANPLRPGGVILPSAAQVATALGGDLVLAVLGLLASQLAIAACTKAIADGYLGGHPTWQDSLRFGASRLGSLVWLTVLTGAGLLVGFLCLFVPGVWLYAAWGVAVPALLLEGRRGTGALGRSFRLVRGRWWPTAAVLLVAIVLRSVVSDVAGGIIDGIVLFGQHSTVLATLVGGIVSAGLAVVLTPFVAAVAVVLYVDLRVRKEGFDLQLLAQSVGTDGPAGPPPGFLPPTYSGPFPGGGPWGPPGGPWGPGPDGAGQPWGAGPGGPWSPGSGTPPGPWGAPAPDPSRPTPGWQPTPPGGACEPTPPASPAPPPDRRSTPRGEAEPPPAGTAWTMPASARGEPPPGPPAARPASQSAERAPSAPPSLLPPDWQQAAPPTGRASPGGTPAEARAAEATREPGEAREPEPAEAREPGGTRQADQERGPASDPDGGSPSSR